MAPEPGETLDVGLLEGMATTRAIRRFRPDPIPNEDLAKILFAATRAPTGSNRQPFRFVVLRGGPKAGAAKAVLGESFRASWAAYRSAARSSRAEDGNGSGARARLARTMQEFVDNFEQIPVVILPCLIRYRDPNPYEGASIYPACQNLLLAARALGYGGTLTMWHFPREAELREVLGIPAEVSIAATIVLGRPQGHHGPVRRRPLTELVYENGWNETAAWASDPPGSRFGTGLSLR